MEQAESERAGRDGGQVEREGGNTSPLERGIRAAVFFPASYTSRGRRGSQRGSLPDRWTAGQG